MTRRDLRIGFLFVAILVLVAIAGTALSLIGGH
jgi:hypothetical protein